MDHIVKKTAALYGILGALITVGLYLYVWREQDFLNTTIGVVIISIPVITGIASQIHSKNKLNGYLSLKQAVLAFVVCVAIIFISEAVINYLIYVIWDPAVQDQVAQMTADLIEQRRASSNQQIEDVAREYTLSTYAQAAIRSLLMYTVIGIIAGLIIKKNPTA